MGGARRKTKRGKRPRKTATYPLHLVLRCVDALPAPPPFPQICKVRGVDAPFTPIPIGRCVPSGFKVSFFLHQPAPISDSAGVEERALMAKSLGRGSAPWKSATATFRGRFAPAAAPFV